MDDASIFVRFYNDIYIEFGQNIASAKNDIERQY